MRHIVWSLVLGLGWACTAPGPDSPDVDTAPDTDDTGEPASPTLILGEPLECAAPVALGWDEVGAERGLLPGPDPDAAHGGGAFAVVGELDGRPGFDLAVDFPGELQVYSATPEGWRARTAYQGVESARLTLLDLDGDDVQELLRGGNPVTRWTIADEAPLSSTPLFELVPSRGAGGVFPAHLDDDAHIDLFAMAGNPGLSDFVLRGDGQGGFTPDFEAWPESLAGGLGFDALSLDLRGDGDMELYVLNDQGPTHGPNELAELQGDTWVDIGPGSGCDLSLSAMGADVADVDGDLLPDLYIGGAAVNYLLRTLDDGSCVDVFQTYGFPAMPANEMAWGTAFWDADNDGDPDVFEARGDLWSPGDEAWRMYDTASRAYRHDGDHYTDVTADWGLDAEGSFRSVVPFDQNADGVLDLLVTDIVARPVLYLSRGCTAAAWIEIAAPLGARIEVEAGGRRQVQWATTHSGMGGVRPALAHFGLGEVATVDEVRVTLRDGRVYTTDGPVAPNRRIWTPEGPDPWLGRP